MINHVEPSNASRKLSKAFKDGWDAIWGKKKKPANKKASKRARDAADKVLHNPENSKKAKTERGEALTQKRKPKWGDPTIRME